MKRILLWLLDYWRVPFLLLVVAATWWWARRRAGALRSPADDLRLELDAIEAARQARSGEALVGRERTIEALQAQYAMTMQRLDAEQQQKADDLRHNPAQLAKFLVMAGRKR